MVALCVRASAFLLDLFDFCIHFLLDLCCAFRVVIYGILLREASNWSMWCYIFKVNAHTFAICTEIC